MSHGVRIPSILPRETVTYNLYQDMDIPDSLGDSQILIVANYEVH
jgi:hypothetical protein